MPTDLAMKTAAQLNRPEMPSPLATLNEQQRAFVSVDGHSICVACPGSGKTRTLVAKAHRLIHEHGLTKVLALTFTRAAVAEMRDRLGRALGEPLPSRAHVYTFHGLAFRQLSRNRAVKLVSDAERHGLIIRARERAGCDWGLERLTEAIAGFKRQHEPTATSGDEDPSARAVFQEYQRGLTDHGVMDMDDLLITLLQAYQSGALTPLPVTAMLVDELQDVDEVQLRLVLAYAKAGAQIHVVADDDQSIYGFRAGLGYQAVTRLTQALSPSMHHLDINYRCAPAIVALAERVINHNAFRLPKLLRSGASGDTLPLVVACASVFDEAEAVVHAVGAPHNKHVTVLARTNHWLDTIEVVAVSANLVIRRVGERSFLARRHIAQALSAIRFGLNPEARLALLSSLHVTGISMSALTTLETRLAQPHPTETLIDRLYDAELLEGLGKTDATLFREFRVALTNWAEACLKAGAAKGQDQSDDLTDALLHLLRLLVEQAVSDWHRQDLITLARLLTQRLSGPVQSRLRAIDQWAKRSKQTDAESVPQLTLMTIHGAKGLEFDTVWVAGCNEDILPYEGNPVEEERRLFYVGVTRARQTLITSFVKDDKREVSRFLLETETAITPWQGRPD